MIYDKLFERWIVRMAENEVPMNCGEHLKVINTGHTIPCRLEFAKEWYVIMDGAKFDLRKSDKYIIQVS